MVSRFVVYSGFLRLTTVTLCRLHDNNAQKDLHVLNCSADIRVLSAAPMTRAPSTLENERGNGYPAFFEPSCFPTSPADTG